MTAAFGRITNVLPPSIQDGGTVLHFTFDGEEVSSAPFANEAEARDRHEFISDLSKNGTVASKGFLNQVGIVF